MTVTKESLTEAVSSEAGLSRKQSAELVEALIELIRKTLGAGEDVLISGFGKFCVKVKGQMRGRNPATGEALMLAPRRVVAFRCSGKLREKINKPQSA